MLCAFFDKRLRVNTTFEEMPPDSLGPLLFDPFWATVTKFDSTLSTLQYTEGQWKLPENWKLRASQDGSSNALILLQFRVNRMCKLLSVSDCWAANIGRHLAHWLDSHMHLVLACDERHSGPQLQDAALSSNLSLCDWRKKYTALSAGIRSNIFQGDTLTQKTSVHLFLRMFSNMAACKSLSTLLVQADVTARPSICAAVVKSILGQNAIRATFELRRAVHKSMKKGHAKLFDMVVAASVTPERPIIFMCMREYVSKCITDDVSMSALLDELPRLKMFISNVGATMNGLLLALNAIGPALETDDIYSWISTVKDDRLSFFTRCAKRTPGPVARAHVQKLTLTSTTRAIRRMRDRSRSEKAIVTENFFSPNDVGQKGLMSLLGPYPLWDFIKKTLKHANAFSEFHTLVQTMFGGSPTLETIFMNGTPTEPFRVASDLLEIVQIGNSVQMFALPRSFAVKQQTAIQKRFKDTSCHVDELIQRAGQIIWCSSCKKIKNFVIEHGKKNDAAYGSHGYKRICHAEGELLCDERRLFECCKTVPLKHIKLIDNGIPYCAEICGQAYCITTCCGRIALFDRLQATLNSPLTCKLCATPSTDKHEVAQKICHFCESTVVRKKGTFTGSFTDEDGDLKTLTFCKRHTRAFMRRDREPMILSEVMAEIPKRKRS
jgi:hypothetical protein